MCNSFQFIALNVCQSVSAKLVGFPSAARHLKPHSTAYISMNPVSAEKSLETILFTSVKLKWFCLVMKKQPLWEMGFIQAILLDKQHTIWKRPYQVSLLGICLWLVQIISGVQGPKQILDEEGGEKLSKKRTLRSHFAVSQTKLC